MWKHALTLATIVSAGFLSSAVSWAKDAPAPASQVDPATYQAVTGKAVAFLLKSQGENGSFDPKNPAITALATTALLRNGRTISDPVVEKSLKYLQGFVQKDGGLYSEGSTHKNYETSVALICFTEANANKQYDKLIQGADAFLKGLQWDQGEDADRASTNYGGAGYGSHKRPDLSNTSFLIDALKAAGNGPNDEAMQKALVFVSRCQNLESEHNTTPFAAKNPDGGFYYTPAAGGTSQAGATETGGLRSYGSMTYAGLKSMIFAGVDANDPRVKAAFKWATNHYTLEENPGMGGAGLYYYYHTFAKALDAIGQPIIEDSAGVKHDWRAELVSELASRQKADGSFINDTTRWMEGDPVLVTSYALLTLPYCKPTK
jgi:squalene-hopene/tetraprenyl-beta-curcumene cyclase